MHENQLTYPPPPGEKRDLNFGMINTLSMVCTDRVAFNSQYHLASFFDELPRLLKHFPDYNHLELVPDLLAKSQVLPGGVGYCTPGQLATHRETGEGATAPAPTAFVLLRATKRCASQPYLELPTLQ